jgi:hypothetical protein
MLLSNYFNLYQYVLYNERRKVSFRSEWSSKGKHRWGARGGEWYLPPLL